jgi:hypothetical protein
MQETRGRADLTGVHEEAVAPHRGAAGALVPLGLLLVSAAVVWMRWGKVYSLVGLDQSWWLGCLARVVAGEIPYRDFLWHYPPLSLILLGCASRWFGVSFTTIQIVVNLWSAAIVLLLYLIFRRFLSPWLNFLSGVITIAVCATTQSYFGLYYIPNYSHALLTAVIGILLFLLGCLRYLEDGRLQRANGLLLGGGSFVALLSKQEPFIAVLGMLAVLAFADVRLSAAGWSLGRLFRLGGSLGALCMAPAAIAYALLGHVVGYQNLWTAFLGYGVASGTCPWWPTGIGLLGTAAALGCAVAFVALASLADRQAWKNHRYLLWLAGLMGVAAYAAYEYVLFGELILGVDPWPRKLSRLAPLLLSSSTFLRPVLWGAIVYWIYLLSRALRRTTEFGLIQARIALLLAPAILLSMRSLFGSILSPAPEAPAIAYPFLLALAPFLMSVVLTWPYRAYEAVPAGARRRIAAVITLTLAAYIAVRIVGGYAGMFSDREYTPLHTPAGLVKIRDGSVEAEIYRYAAAHTSPGDTLMELPIGGGIGFVLGRTSPTFSTLFIQVRTSPETQQRDLDQFRKSPPAVIVAPAKPHYGAVYGMEGCTGCTFPYLRWRPHQMRAPAEAIVPVIKQIEESYRVDRSIGPWILLRPLRSGTGVNR